MINKIFPRRLYAGSSEMDDVEMCRLNELNELIKTVTNEKITDPASLAEFAIAVGIAGRFGEFAKKAEITDPKKLAQFAVAVGITAPQALSLFIQITEKTTTIDALALFAIEAKITEPKKLAQFAIELGITTIAKLAQLAKRAGITEPEKLAQFAIELGITTIAKLAQFAKEAGITEPKSLAKFIQEVQTKTSDIFSPKIAKQKEDFEEYCETAKLETLSERALHWSLIRDLNILNSEADSKDFTKGTNLALFAIEAGITSTAKLIEFATAVKIKPLLIRLPDPALIELAVFAQKVGITASDDLVTLIQKAGITEPKYLALFAQVANITPLAALIDFANKLGIITIIELAKFTIELGIIRPDKLAQFAQVAKITKLEDLALFAKVAETGRRIEGLVLFAKYAKITKSNELGWFAQNTISIDPRKSFITYLAAFAISAEEQRIIANLHEFNLHEFAEGAEETEEALNQWITILKRDPARCPEQL